jgi:hypothetical protein
MMAATAQPSATLAAVVPADEDQHKEQENGATGNDGNENVDHGVLSGSVSNLVRLYDYPNNKRPAKNRNHGPVPAHRLLTIALDQIHGLAYIKHPTCERGSGLSRSALFSIRSGRGRSPEYPAILPEDDVNAFFGSREPCAAAPNPNRQNEVTLWTDDGTLSVSSSALV